MKTYTVTVTAKFPPAGERPGSFEIVAASKKEAISKARAKMRNLGHDRHDGPMIYSATEEA